jgi:hypothetical protein
MPAYCNDGYAIYCQWCVEHHREPPTRAWWDHSCIGTKDYRPMTDVEFDVQTEQREGWCYGDRI